MILNELLNPLILHNYLKVTNALSNLNILMNKYEYVLNALKQSVKIYILEC